MYFGDFISSAYLKMINLVFSQKAIGGLSANPQHFTHLLHADHIRVLLKDQLICFIAFQKGSAPFCSEYRCR